MKDKLSISALQLDIVWENPKANFKKVNNLINSNSLINVDVLVLPELFTTGFTMDVYDNYDKMNGETIEMLRTISNNYNIAVCGSVLIKQRDSFYNRFVFVNKDIELITYDKKHLFRMGKENDHYTAGDKKQIFNFNGFRILPLICYDLRFPVWSRYSDDYDVIIYVANWPMPRRNHWDILLKARAIENQAYVVGVNRIGVDGNNYKYNGGTAIINYKGDVISKSGDNKESIISSSISKSEINDYRNSFPAWKDKDDFELK